MTDEDEAEQPEIGVTPEEAGIEAPDVDIDPEDVDVDEISDLSTEELLALSGGGVVDAEGNATAYGADGVAREPGAEADPSAEATAERLSDHLDEISEETNSTQQEMFTDAWMTAHTEFESIEAFLDAGPWAVGTEIWDIPTDQLDAHAATHSAFEDWQAMSAAAGDEWMDDKLAFLEGADGDDE